MSDTTGEAGIQEAVAVYCEACGRRFRARSWHEGIICARCHSGKVRPLVAPGGAVDYCVADRSKGYALADVRFAQWAKWCELITPYQYELALLKQNRQIQEGNAAQPVHEIMIQEGFLAEKESLRLLEFLSRPRPDEDDGRFVQRLQATTDVDAEKVQQTQSLQLRDARRYHEVPPLCQLLMERGVINEAQMLAVLRLQQRNGHGTLRIAHDMAVEPARRRPLGALRKALSLRNPPVRAAALIAALFLLGLGIWWRQAATGGHTMYVRCEACGQINKVRWSKTFPVQCPQCGKTMAFYAKICENGNIFTVKSPYVPEPLPDRCEGTYARPLTARDLP